MNPIRPHWRSSRMDRCLLHRGSTLSLRTRATTQDLRDAKGISVHRDRDWLAGRNMQLMQRGRKNGLVAEPGTEIDLLRRSPPGPGIRRGHMPACGPEDAELGRIVPKNQVQRDSTTGDATRVWRFPNPCGDWYLRKLSVGLWSRRLQVQISSGIFFISRVVSGQGGA